MKTKKILNFALLSILSMAAPILKAEQIKHPYQEGRFKPTVESLQQNYVCPEWFRDAKFGIWSHWTAYTVAGNDWYARNMYIEGNKEYVNHCKRFGHPSEFGYKDVVDLWTGENFDAEEQIKLFERAGAKYFVALANHHDNFDLWDSKYQPWNAVNYGPKRDIVGEWREAVLKTNMRWGVTSHLERAWSWFQVNKLSDKKGEYAGIPYDGANPEYEQMYLPADPTGDTSRTQPKNATPWWRQYWFNRCADLIDRYKPDLFYVDGGVPFPGDDNGHTGLKMISHLYNQNSSWHNGENEAVMCIKNWLHVAPKGEWGHYWDGVATLDFERGRASGILDKPWQTDTSLGPWTWVPNIDYRNADVIIPELIDIVSKNGNMLLNACPGPDGKLDDEIVDILGDIGRWMDVNSESIYSTRPWIIYGAEDLRVVKKGADDDLLYVSSLKPIECDRLNIPFFAKSTGGTINKITLLATGENLKFEKTADGVDIQMPKEMGGEYAWVFKIKGERLSQFDVDDYKTDKGKSVDRISQEIEIWYNVSQKDVNSQDALKGVAYDQQAAKWGIAKDDTLVSFEGENTKSYPYKVVDIDFTTNGYSAFATTDGSVYLGNNNNWKEVFKPKVEATRVALSETGELYVLCKDHSIWFLGRDNSNPIMIPNMPGEDIACDNNGLLAVADTGGIIRFFNGIERVSKPIGRGGGITRVEFSPKTNHIVAIYSGKLSFFKDNAWFFTDICASEIAAGKSNDDEIIGWVD